MAPICTQISTNLWEVTFDNITLVVEYSGSNEEELVALAFPKIIRGDYVSNTITSYDHDDEVLD